MTTRVVLTVPASSFDTVVKAEDHDPETDKWINPHVVAELPKGQTGFVDTYITGTRRVVIEEA